jgi:hypothetical protein
LKKISKKIKKVAKKGIAGDKKETLKKIETVIKQI